MKNPEKSQQETLISGKYSGEGLAEVGNAKKKLEEAGFGVLYPEVDKTIDKGASFVIFRGDEGLNYELEMKFLKKINKADFLYVSNLGGRIGESASTEVAFANLIHKPVIFSEPIKEISEKISKEAQEILLNKNLNVVLIEEISFESIDDVLNKEVNPLTEEQKKVLLPLIKKLVENLKKEQIIELMPFIVKVLEKEGEI